MQELQRWGLLHTSEPVVLQANRPTHRAEKSSLVYFHSFIRNCTHGSVPEQEPSDGAFSGAPNLVFSPLLGCYCMCVHGQCWPKQLLWVSNPNKVSNFIYCHSMQL